MRTFCPVMCHFWLHQLQFFQQIYFVQNVPLDTWIALLSTPDFSKKPKNFLKKTVINIQNSVSFLLFGVILDPNEP